MATRQSQSRQSYGGSLLALENSTRLLPAAGSTTQVLAKTGSADYAVAWTAASGLPATAVQTSAFSPALGQMVLCNAVAGGFAITLPSSAGHGSQIAVKKIDASTNAITIGAGGTSIETAGTTSFTLSQPNATVVFDYDNNNTIWRVVVTAAPVSAAAGTYVPAGGASGQVLAKTSATDYATTWTTPSSGSAGAPALKALQVGSYGDNRFTTYNGTLNAFFASANTCYYIPVYVPVACTINQLVVCMTAGSTAVTTSLAMLSATAAGAPQTLLALPVTLSISTTTGPITVTYNAQLNAGWNFFGWGWPVGTPSSTFQMSSLPPAVTACPFAPTTTAGFATGYQATSAAAAAPANSPTVTWFTAASTPLVGYRVASIP